MTTIQRQKCGRCKMNMTLDKYVKKRDDTYAKRCIECNLYCKNSSDRNKCEHGRRKDKCVECDGGGICEHKKRKERCVECNGSQICEHKKLKSRCVECCGGEICEHEIRKERCVECNGSGLCEHKKRRELCKTCSDPKKVIVGGWLNRCRTSDKFANRFDIVNYIDKCFCHSLLEEYPNCYYCKIELQYVINQGDLATIERLDNDIGHIKSNCVIACLHCNVSKLSNK
jgi:hypothetical protein